MYNWIKRIFFSQPLTLRSPEIQDLLSGSRPNHAGVTVNPKTILGNPNVWKAVNLISGKISTLDLSVLKQDQDGKEVAANHPAHWLLRYQPSPLYTPQSWKKTVVFHRLIYGVHYSYVLRNEFGNPTELMILDPVATRLNTYEPDNLVYDTVINSKTYRLPLL